MVLLNIEIQSRNESDRKNTTGFWKSCSPIHKLPYCAAGGKTMLLERRKKNSEKYDWMTHVNDHLNSIEEEFLGLYIHLPFCESLCTYCGCNKRITKNHKVEEPYIKALLTEWELYLNLNGFNKVRLSKLHLGGGTPTFFSVENLRQLILGLKSTGIFLEDCAMSFEGHPSNTSEEHLSVLAQLGFNRLSLGIQDFSETVQFLINRYQTVDEVRAVVSNARRYGYESINFDVVYGLPGQTLDSLKETIQACIDLGADRIAYYSYAHVPWMYKGQRRYKDSQIPGSELKESMLELGKEMFAKAGYDFIGLDHFAKPEDKLSKANKSGTMYRDFMGYSDMSTDGMIGLGCSAISDIGNCYAQNEKVLETYTDFVSNSGSSVVKGHKLSASEIITKRIVQDVMCNKTIDLKTLPMCQQHRYDQKSPQLKKMQLVQENNHQMEITPLGRNYLRNIASVFDPYFSSDEDKELYSKAL